MARCKHGRLAHPVGRRRCKKRPSAYRARRSTAGRTRRTGIPKKTVNRIVSLLLLNESGHRYVGKKSKMSRRVTEKVKRCGRACYGPGARGDRVLCVRRCLEKR